MHRARCASSRGLAQVRRPFRAPSASIASARQHLLPRPASPAELPRLPWPPVPSESRRRAAPPQDPAPAAQTARAPVAETSAAPLRCSRLPVSAGTLPRLLSPEPFGSLPRAALPRYPVPAARAARAPVAKTFAPPPCHSPPPASGTLAHLPSPPARSAFRRRVARPQEPAPAARPDRAPALVVAAVRCRALQS